jgi:hypothetical protein
MEGLPPVTPMTALIVDDDGRLTYVGADGCRRVIVGDSDLLQRLKQLRKLRGDEMEGGCGI